MSKKKQQSKESAPRTVTLTVGTAGHIDHGKTELVKMLTGCDTDCLPEEQARGMTIDLGFATCALTNNRRVGIVDVPGHEKFVHNMVAGAAGIDAVLLVVAADDGVMPQTIEHFHIVRLLGVRHGFVAVTKIDLVEPERVEEVKAQVRELVSNSFLEDCPVVGVSSKTAAGFDDFYNTFVKIVDRTAERSEDGPFRLHIERSFIIKGRGVIVSGIPCSGMVKVGDNVELLPAGEKRQVRGLQVYGTQADEGRSGECVALHLNDISKKDAARGVVLAKPGYFSPSRFINIHFQLLPGLDRPIKPRTAVRLHVGTSSVRGYLVLPDLEPLKPGQESYVQIQLAQPVVAAAGDFVVVRLLSPAVTLGGGSVVSTVEKKLRRSNKDWSDDVREQEAAASSTDTAVLHALKEAGSTPVTLARIARDAMATEDAAKKCLDALTAGGTVYITSAGKYVHADAVDKAAEVMVGVFEKLHRADPMYFGFPTKELFRGLKMDHGLAGTALVRLENDGRVVQGKRGLVLDGHMPRLSEVRRAIADRIVDEYAKTGLVTPRADEIPVSLGIPAEEAGQVIEYLLQCGELVAVDDKVILHAKCLEDAREKIVVYIEENGRLESAEAKSMMATTRKYAIPILEYLDGQGVTKRVGNARVLRED